MTIAALSDYSNISYIVDKNPKAQGIFAPKSHLPVFGIEELGKHRADKILVFSFGYFHEIVEEIGRDRHEPIISGSGGRAISRNRCERML